MPDLCLLVPDKKSVISPDPEPFLRGANRRAPREPFADRLLGQHLDRFKPSCDPIVEDIIGAAGRTRGEHYVDRRNPGAPHGEIVALGRDRAQRDRQGPKHP